MNHPRIRKKMKVSYNGESVEAEQMDVEKSDEFWNQYTLDDGTKVKYKSVAVEIWRLVGKVDSEGKPIILVKAQHLAVIA